MTIYQLHVIEAPHVRTLKEAGDFIDHWADREAAEASDALGSFLRRAGGVFPDRSEKDVDGKDKKNIWAEGLQRGPMHRPLLQLAIKDELLTQLVLESLWRTAGSVGCHLVDREGGALYLADGKEVSE